MRTKSLIRGLIFTGLMALCASVSTGHSAESSKKIRVLSWNIEWFPGKLRSPTPEQSVAHAKLVRSEMEKLNPDILLAQEIGNWQAFADLVSVIPAFQPAVVSAFTSEETGEYWSQQLAVASKLPIFAAWSEKWKAGESITPRRGFSAAALEIPGSDQLLLVYSVHFKSNRSKSDEESQLNFDTRDESARQLIAHVNEMENAVFKGRIAGVIIGGDFNTNHDGQFGDSVVSIIEQAGFISTWGDRPRADRATWRGDQRFEPTTFDYIFVKGLGNPAAELVPVSDGLSDHWPTAIDITLPSAKP